MTNHDDSLLTLLQSSVPLEARPFDAVAREVGATVEWVIGRVSTWREEGIIREISAIFDVTAMGYAQALVAMAVPAELLDRAGEAAAGHPGVSHCYARRGRVVGGAEALAYNLWLTLAVSPRSGLGLERTAAVLAAECHAQRHLVLPTLRPYKLEVQWHGRPAHASQGHLAPVMAVNTEEATGETPVRHMGGAPMPPHQATGGTPVGRMGETPMPRHGAADLTDSQLRAIRALQADLPAVAEPFEPLARRAGMSVDELLGHARQFLRDGQMRRYAAVLHHRSAGAAANVLAVWAIDPATADAAGAACARVTAVSHCYLRPTAPDWPFNLYTMIHGRTEAECHLAIEEIAATTSLCHRAELWTGREFKKRRVELFSPAEQEWEAARRDRRPPS